MLLHCTHIGPVVWKMDDSAAGANFWSDACLTVHYGYFLAADCKSVVHLLLWCIVGLNECTRLHPLWSWTALSPQIVLYLEV